MDLLSSKLPRHITRKNRMYGFEVSDLVILFLYFIGIHFALTLVPYKFLIATVTTLIFAFILHRFKSDKPDHYLEHCIKYQFGRNIYAASLPDTEFVKLNPRVQ